MEMQKFFTLMDGCPKHKIGGAWMKAMLNWDLLTHPEAESFGSAHTIEEKVKLSHKWKQYMEETNSWISFYSWKNMRQTKDVMMADDRASTSSLHSWSTLDGSKVETVTTFPPYKGIVLGEGQNSAKAIPMVLKDDNALGIDGRIQKASEQLNWTNTSVKGL